MKTLKFILFLFILLVLVQNVFASNVGVGLSFDFTIKEPECSTNSNCNDNNNYTYDSCINPGNFDSYCKHEDIACFKASDCGNYGFINNKFCKNSDVYREYKIYNCLNPGTAQSTCKEEISSLLLERCIFSCLNGVCLKDTIPPEAIIKFDSKINDFAITGIDNSKSNVQVTMSESCKNDLCTREYTLTDPSKNTLKINMLIQKYKSIEKFNSNGNLILFMKILNLTYNNKESYPLTNSNQYLIKNNVKIQQLTSLDKTNININYNNLNNKNLIQINLNKSSITGLRLIGLSTSKGKINYFQY